MTRTRLLVAAALATIAAAATASVAGSKHDLGGRGPGQASPCAFCHVTHQASGGRLSNRPVSGAAYRTYESGTARWRSAGPDGASRLCLSCHDGTVAVGRTARGTLVQGRDDRIPSGKRSNLGTDLRGTHPVSVVLAPSDSRRAPPPGDPVRLDEQRKVQCTSCHDPHEEWRDPRRGKFLVKPASGGSLCTSCHVGRDAGSHANLQGQADAVAGEAGPTGAAALEGCDVCHVSHGADPRGQLLRGESALADDCLACHARGTSKSIGPDVAKPYGHAPLNAGTHDAAEGGVAPGGARLPERSPAALRHVVCVDCHDPHRARPGIAVAPMASPATDGAWGVTIDGATVAPSRFEYELCFKCHGDSANAPAPTASRAAPRNLRLVFGPSAVSSHPVAAPGRSAAVPSLLAPLTPGSMIRCTDCHASDSGPGAGGSGPRGPHGSVHEHLLERPYLTSDFTPEGPGAYALCYKCHDRRVLLSDASSFRPHARHVVAASAPCAACHDPHGVARSEGNERNNAHLVRFDPAIVAPGPSGPARYEATGPASGNCTLVCHGVEHGPSLKPFAY